MIERVSISIDEETRKKLEVLKEGNKNVSDICRKLIDIGFELQRLNVDLETIKIWLGFLADGCVTLDTDHWRIMVSEVEKDNNEFFWDKMTKVAFAHAVRFELKGLNTIYKILNYLSKANWFKMKIEDEGVYTLIFDDESAKKFVVFFIEKVFEKQKLFYELDDCVYKVIIIDKSQIRVNRKKVQPILK